MPTFVSIFIDTRRKRYQDTRSKPGLNMSEFPVDHTNDSEVRSSSSQDYEMEFRVTKTIIEDGDEGIAFQSPEEVSTNNCLNTTGIIETSFLNASNKNHRITRESFKQSSGYESAKTIVIDDGSNETSIGSNISYLFQPTMDLDPKHDFYKESQKDQPSNADLRHIKETGAREYHSSIRGDFNTVQLACNKGSLQMPSSQLTVTTAHLLSSPDQCGNQPMPLHEVLLEADRQQNEDLIQIIPHPYLPGQKLDVYVLSNEHQYEELKDLKPQQEPRTKLRLTSTSSSGGSNLVTVNDRRSITDYMSSGGSSSSHSSNCSVRLLNRNEIGTPRVHEDLFSNDIEYNSNFRNATRDSFSGATEIGISNTIKTRKHVKDGEHRYSRSKSTNGNAVSKKRKPRSYSLRMENVNIPSIETYGMCTVLHEYT